MTGGITAACLVLGLGTGLSRAGVLGDPSPTQAIESHAMVRSWVAAWSVPDADAPDSSAQPITTEPIWGAAVTIRVDGRVLSRGSWYADQAPSGLAVYEAAGRAIRAARAALPDLNDALSDERVSAMGQRATVSLELIAQAVPIPPGELGLPMAGCSPGAEALIVRAAGVDGRIEVVGVDEQLTRGLDPAQELSAAAAGLAGDGRTALATLTELSEAGYSFARARVVHLAMPFSNAAAVFLDRGASRVPQGAVRASSLRSTADLIAAHLRSRVWPGVERYGIGSDLNIVTGAIDAPFAGPFEQSLAALALLEHADLGTADAEESRESAFRIVRDLAGVEPGEASPWATPVGAAAGVIAIRRASDAGLEPSPAIDALRIRCLATLGDAYQPESGFADSVPVSARGLIAWGLVRAIGLDSAFTRELGESAVRRAFRETPPDGLVAQMPFLAWGELELHPRGDLPSQQALVAMRDQLYAFQVHWRDLRPMDRDMAGGVVFTRSGVPLPGWQTLRPMASIASLLGDARATPGQLASVTVSRELVRLSDALRFTRQLVISGDGLFLARNPTQANGGVRRALWEPVASPEAGALALLTVCESLESMGELTRRAMPGKAGSGGDGAESP